MGKIHKNQNGFSAIEAILILLIVAIIGGTGWYVYDVNKKTNNTYNAANQNGHSMASYGKSKKRNTVNVDPTASWTAYSSTDGKLFLKYPKAWVTASHPELCSPGILLLGSDSKSVGTCGSNNFGQVSITWQPQHADCADLSSDNKTATDLEKVTVSGVTGLKRTLTVKAGGQPQAGNPSAGTMMTNYCFNTNSYTYVANYTQLSGYPDALADFNLMVTKTLKFN